MTNLDTKSFCDIGFLLDTSGSISRDSYILEKEFVANIAERLSISENGNHYGVVLFGAYANVEIPFNRYFDLSTFQRAVLSMPQSGSITRIDRGLYKVYSELFRDKRDHRENAKKILFLLTDGEQSIGSDVLNNKLIADTLRYTGVSLIIIGVGSDVKPEDLLKIDENVYLARNFEELISDTFYKKLNISCSKRPADWNKYYMDLRIVNQRSVSSAVRIIAESDKTTFEIESGGWEEISRIRFSKNIPYVQVSSDIQASQVIKMNYLKEKKTQVLLVDTNGRLLLLKTMEAWANYFIKRGVSLYSKN